jgi:hypothetical protein
MAYKKGDLVIVVDGRIETSATVVKDGIDNKGRVRVRVKGFPMDMSISVKSESNLYIKQ